MDFPDGVLSMQLPLHCLFASVENGKPYILARFWREGQSVFVNPDRIQTKKGPKP